MKLAQAIPNVHKNLKIQYIINSKFRNKMVGKGLSNIKFYLSYSSKQNSLPTLILEIRFPSPTLFQIAPGKINSKYLVFQYIFFATVLNKILETAAKQ